jgi:hypothetical protein
MSEREIGRKGLPSVKTNGGVSLVKNYVTTNKLSLSLAFASTFVAENRTLSEIDTYESLVKKLSLCVPRFGLKVADQNRNAFISISKL